MARRDREDGVAGGQEEDVAAPGTDDKNIVTAAAVGDGYELLLPFVGSGGFNAA